MRRVAGLIAALLLSLVPATADMGGGNNLNGFGANVASSGVTKIPLPSLTRGTCVTDTANATTYNSAGFQATGTGADDNENVLVVVGVIAEDSAITFGCSSLSIDGVAASEIIDEDGSGATNTCLYRTSGVATGRATVNVSVTMTEAVTSATVCAWALQDLVTATPDSSVADDDAASGALVLTTGTTVSPGFVVGVCGSDATGQTTSWAVATERQDTCDAEKCYSNADVATTGASMSNTCDWGTSTTADTSGVAAAFH